jgi:hypothetical protein
MYKFATPYGVRATMSRSSTNGLSIDVLERMLGARRRQLRKLSRRRERIARRLAVLDRQIEALAGAGTFSAGSGRVRNDQSLVQMIEGVLGKTRKAMNVGEIAAAVQRKGYRSSSANFRGIVNQTLIKEKQFSQASRGMYQLKK